MDEREGRDPGDDAPAEERGVGDEVAGVRQAWTKDWGWESPTDPAGGNREPEATARGRARRSRSSFAVRSCGMEARGEPQHRTQVKPRKAGPAWVSVLRSATPDIQPRRDGIGDGGGGTLFVLTLGDLHGSASSGRRQGGNDELLMSAEKSDHPIRALSPGNAGGAKGVMG